ncbi:hypothetical protein NBRC116594_14950 [Shimia sp. NS0008-38b]
MRTKVLSGPGAKASGIAAVMKSIAALIGITLGPPEVGCAPNKSAAMCDAV